MNMVLGTVKVRKGDEWMYRDMRVYPDKVMLEKRCTVLAQNLSAEVHKAQRVDAQAASSSSATVVAANKKRKYAGLTINHLKTNVIMKRIKYKTDARSGGDGGGGEEEVQRVDNDDGMAAAAAAPPQQQQQQQQIEENGAHDDDLVKELFGAVNDNLVHLNTKVDAIIDNLLHLNTKVNAMEARFVENAHLINDKVDVLFERVEEVEDNVMGMLSEKLQ